MFSLPLMQLLAISPLPLASFASVMWGLLSVVLILTCLLLILIILLQDPKSAGLSSAFGAGGGGNDSLLGAQAQRGVSRLTAFLAVVFVVLAVVLVLIDNNTLERSPGTVGASDTPAAGAPAVDPLVETSGGEALPAGTAIPTDVDGGDVDAPPAIQIPPATSGDAGDTPTTPTTPTTPAPTGGTDQ